MKEKMEAAFVLFKNNDIEKVVLLHFFFIYQKYKKAPLEEIKHGKKKMVQGF